MGTRSFIGFVRGGEVFGSYNQYDGYPEGVGADLQQELKGDPSFQDWDKLSNSLSTMRWVDSGDNPTEAEKKTFADSWEAVSSGNDWYSFLRDHQGSMIKRLKAGVATGEPNFPKDSLFCEWGYVFDVDARQVIILEGFNTKKSKEWKYADTGPKKDWKPSYDGEHYYAGCSVFWSGTMDEFLAIDMETIQSEMALT